MEEVMYWCPCQLAMKNNVKFCEDYVEFLCKVIDWAMCIPQEYSQDNYYVDTTIHKFCKECCEYYRALIDMSSGEWIN